jgi:hypothetical protein
MITIEGLSQYQQIRGDLLAGLSITPLEALNRYGCFRLAAVVYKLRKEGHKIITEDVTSTTPEGTKHFARYRLANPQVVQPELPFDETVVFDGVAVHPL